MLEDNCGSVVGWKLKFDIENIFYLIDREYGNVSGCCSCWPVEVELPRELSVMTSPPLAGTERSSQSVDS